MFVGNVKFTHVLEIDPGAEISFQGLDITSHQTSYSCNQFLRFFVICLTVNC